MLPMSHPTPASARERAPERADEIVSAARLQGWIANLEAGLLERGAAVRLALLGALAGEHVLFIGPPGSAKSELARRLHSVFADAPYFERLLTRFSTPEELFGPLSLKALEDDRYERLIDGYLPRAGLAFLDEVFKANLAILNALLTLLNEREYDHGSGRIRTPLVCVVGATNDVPSDESLRAFLDRFLLRVPVQPVSDAAFAPLLNLRSTALPRTQPIDAAERAALRRCAESVPLGDEAIAALAALRAWLAARQMPVSDRRWRQLAGLLRVQAATQARAAVDAVDLWLVPFVVSETAAQADAVAQWFADEVLAATPQEASWLTRAVEAFEQQLRVECAPASDFDDAGAGKMAAARNLGAAQSENEIARLPSALSQPRTTRRFSGTHIAARLAQIDEVATQATTAAHGVQAQADSLSERLRGRLWIPGQMAKRWCGAHAHTLAVLRDLTERLNATRCGFALLPQDPDTQEALAPQPVRLDMPVSEP